MGSFKADLLFRFIEVIMLNKNEILVLILQDSYIIKVILDIIHEIEYKLFISFNTNQFNIINVSYEFLRILRQNLHK